MANIYDILVFFGTSDEYQEFDSNINHQMDPNGFFTIWWNSENEIEKATIFIKENLKGFKRKDVLKEEITQCLGFSNDSLTSRDSIFYEYKWKYPNLYKAEYSNLDKNIIKFMYSQKNITGMSKQDIINIFTK